jgi:flagellar basal-body rod protein FlgG
VNRAIYTAASGGIAALARLESVSQNLANVNTPGYKAERLVFEVRPLDLDVHAALDPVLGETAAQVMAVASVRDFSQGPVRLSGNPLDLAINGRGFFAVTTPRGERYTRQGAFARDAEGYLVTASGNRVQGEGGDLRLGDGEVAIAEDGTVTVDDEVVGRIRVVDAGDPPALVAEGASLFVPVRGAAAAAPLPADAVRLQAGAIEGANVDPVAGLVELIEVARGFDSYMQALRRIDELAGRAITDVGRV